MSNTGVDPGGDSSITIAEPTVVTFTLWYTIPVVGSRASSMLTCDIYNIHICFFEQYQLCEPKSSIMHIIIILSDSFQGSNGKVLKSTKVNNIPC